VQLPRTAQPPQAPQPRTAERPDSDERERQPAEQRERTPPPPPPAAPPPPGERRPLPTRNVKVDITISEQSSGVAPVKKVVSLVVADGRSSGVRTNTTVPIADGNTRDLPLNVDASVNLTPDQHVLLELRFVYQSVKVMAALAGEGLPDSARPEAKAGASPRPGYSMINNSLTFLLTPGTPVVAARSADAATDRIVTVEVKAEILK
jgi:hypothetical protein